MTPSAYTSRSASSASVGGAAWLRSGGAYLAEPPALDRLGEIVVPVLVLVGGLDLDAVHAAAACVVAETAGARRVDWPDAGHLPALERPADFLDLLREWTAE